MTCDIYLSYQMQHNIKKLVFIIIYIKVVYIAIIFCFMRTKQDNRRTLYHNSAFFNLFSKQLLSLRYQFVIAHIHRFGFHHDINVESLHFIFVEFVVFKHVFITKQSIAIMSAIRIKILFSKFCFWSMMLIAVCSKKQYQISSKMLNYLLQINIKKKLQIILINIQ
ncbi:hypothetical protein RFI_25637 [Reticulomyxa filosa]|uniref:Transmembrane protein n=1 Tax=Reticulomyxa filosa TaxID=46433 RepID=X6MCX3_RETFI|nr:hypothetical protein RFI_25637 [Reticulomyxa filosa]|eukprot:ETO11739.1 hypothetical protein RFI_25637 [Reticulomyxa filosa]